MRTFIALMFVFVLSAGTTFAAEGRPNFGGFFGLFRSSSTTPKEGGTWKDEKRASSTRPMKDEKGMVRPMGKFAGVVTSVSSDSFAINLPGGKDRATTTLKVVVSSDTKFTKGSTTASLSDLSAGTRVAVAGTFSTSTKSIAAQHVLIGGDGMNKGKEMGEKKGLLMRFKHFFEKRGKESEVKSDASIDAAANTPAAAVEGSAAASIFQKFFGWI